MLAALLPLLVSVAVVPDAIFVGGNFWTGNSMQPEVTAIAVWKGRILAVGSDAEITPTAGATTKVVRLNNRRVVPGFYDSHVHLLGGGQQLARVELKDAADEIEFGKRLLAFDASAPRDRWLIGGNWDHERALGGTLPTAALIDKYVKDRPVFLRRYDGHMAVANTAALKLARVTADSQEIPGGVIYRLADGKTPSGVLKDNAMSLVERLVPEPDDAEIAEALRAALKAASEVGVTSVQDMAGGSDTVRRKTLRMLQRMDRDGSLTLRVDYRWPIFNQQELIALGAEANFGSGFVRIGGVKAFMDGSLGSSTAKMFDPFEKEPMNTGVFLLPPPTMKSFVRTADAAGLSVAVHAIGDRANAELLDLFADVAKTNGPRDRRFRIEHAQHLRPADYPRFKALGVIASMQPYHVVDDGRWAEDRIGKERCAASYAYRSLLDAGAVLAFGSDWPVAPLDPLVGLDAAVNRRPLDGKHPNGWFPKQRITVAEAMTAYTQGSAYGGFQEKERGQIAVGFVADFAVLDRDIFAAESRDQLGDTKVMMTVVDGRIVFVRK